MIQVAIFETSHEEDLMEEANSFLEELKENQIVNIEYRMSHFSVNGEQIFSFSLCIVYRI